MEMWRRYYFVRANQEKAPDRARRTQAEAIYRQSRLGRVYYRFGAIMRRLLL